MTVQPLDAEDREVLRRRAQDRLAKAREWNATANPPLVARMSDRVQIDAGDLLALLDQLDAAEQRIRDLTQEVKDERGAALDQMEQVRIRDARIRAVEDVLDTWMTYCQTEQTARALSDIRRALEG